MKTWIVLIIVSGIGIGGCSDNGTVWKDTGGGGTDGIVPVPDTGPHLDGLLIDDAGDDSTVPDGMPVDGPLDATPADGLLDAMPMDGPNDGLPADGYLGSRQRAPDVGWRLAGVKPLLDSLRAMVPRTAHYSIAVLRK